MIKTNS
jgi:hypothetical protein